MKFISKTVLVPSLLCFQHTAQTSCHKSFFILSSFLLQLNTLEQYETLRANVSVMPIEIQLGSKWRLSRGSSQGTAEGQGSHNWEGGQKLCFGLFCSRLQRFRKSHRINVTLSASLAFSSGSLAIDVWCCFGVPH